jgi:hypothetical protein
VQHVRALARLRETVKPIGDERLLQDWAVYGAQSCPGVVGLILVTDERLVFVDTGGGMMAFPILKVSTASVTSPCKITLTAWFGRMSLTFDTPGALGAMLNLVRQNPAWAAVESNLIRPRCALSGVHLVDPAAGAQRRGRALATAQSAT